ncbi:MAG: hypothetical protein AB7H48_05085 [Parachlamydiales bacterium]
MTEEEMRKRFYEALEQEDLGQLRFPFILDRSENDGSIFPYLMSDVETDPKTFRQKDFLTHKINQIKD